MSRYEPKVIEPKWQKKWATDKIYQALDFDAKPKFVMLTEFPYPSGDGLHLGHTREYTLGDIYARYKRMKGYNVLFPMGFDAFGLPTENYAIKNHVSPQAASQTNIENFQNQFNKLGFSYDWSRSISTIEPSYYKWTQWIFLKFFEAGLAVHEETLINWCPFCKTGLANEEVVNSRHERCDNLVSKKTVKQWTLKITKYADRLIEGLQGLDYPARISDQQINWIGKSHGTSLKFKVDQSDQEIEVFTTAIETVFGATFMVLAPEHPLIKKLTPADHLAVVNSYLDQARTKTDLERQEDERSKTGVFSGIYAINPLNNKRIPIWIADYVLMSYGTGAIMAVPGQDERDYQFAQKYKLPIIYVTTENKFVNYTKKIKPNPTKYTMTNSQQFDGLNFKEGRKKIEDWIKKEKLGQAKIQYRIRDWVFSRQRYWGEPIPIIHCHEHGPVSVPEKDLPVVLPAIKDYLPTDNGQSPLSRIEDWVNTVCPICHKPSKRETDTMPNWAGSSWYYLRYYDPHNDREFASPQKLQYWGMVDFYLGGMEHTTLHLLYSRFWHQFLYDQKLVPTKEPYQKRRGQGIILAADGTKMSKSKGNIVNPLEIIDQGYGADAIHLAISFLAPYDQTTPWSPESVVGSYRFLDRVWRLVEDVLSLEPNDYESSRDLAKIIARTTARVEKDLEELNFNVAIAALMEGVNSLYKIKESQLQIKKEDWLEAVQAIVLLLAPFAPHICEELWLKLGQTSSVHLADWPSYDSKLLIESTVKLVVQINGKIRTVLEVPRDSSQTQIELLARDNPHLQTYLSQQSIQRVVFVPNKLINFVI